MIVYTFACLPCDLSAACSVVLQEYIDSLIVETMSLNEQETRAAERQILDSMSDEGMPDSIMRSKVWFNVSTCV